MRRYWWLPLTLLLLSGTGCATSWREAPKRPGQVELVRDQLVIHTDFRLPRSHRLVDDLAALRGDIADSLILPLSDEPIHVYLFESRRRYLEFMQEHFPDVPERRAWFVETDTRLAVYAYWGDQVAIDLRHEAAHGYLHAVVPHIPLWLDEGLAEHFEVARGREGLNKPHLDLLAKQFNQGRWKPDLARLEQMRDATEMSQQDYAESWAWAHLMLHSTPQRREILTNYLARLRMAGTAPPLSHYLQPAESDMRASLLSHMKDLAKSR